MTPAPGKTATTRSRSRPSVNRRATRTLIRVARIRRRLNFQDPLRPCGRALLGLSARGGLFCVSAPRLDSRETRELIRDPRGVKNCDVDLALLCAFSVFVFSFGKHLVMK